MKVKAVGDIIIIEKVKRKNIVKNGVEIASRDESEKNIGVVQSVGDQITEISEGDHVVYANYAGNQIKFSEIDVIALRKSEVIGIVVDIDIISENL